MKNRSLYLWLSILIVSFPNTILADLNLELPQDVQPSIIESFNSTNASTLAERTTGKTILRTLRSQGQIIEDTEINLWIRALGNKLAARAPNSPSPFYFVVSKNTSVNAFATLGGVIVINAGLILNTSSESELAAVIAHEIAHITQRHIPRIIEKAENNKFATGAALVAGLLAASKNSDAGQAIINTALATTAHKQLSFGRDAESEADRVGLRILAAAGFNPLGMPRFLQKLEQYNDQNAEIREFLQNHPLTIKRVSDTLFRANRYGKVNFKEDIRYLYMREKVRSKTNVKHIIPDSLPDKVQNYSRALKLKNQRAYAKASLELKTLNNDTSVAILSSELQTLQNRPEKAIQNLRSLLKIYPGNKTLSITLAQAYLSIGQVEQAWQLLNKLKITEQTSLEVFEVKKDVAQSIGNPAQAYKAVAERSIRQGRYNAAIAQLRKAIQSPGANVNDIKEMEDLLDTLQSRKRR